MKSCFQIFLEVFSSKDMKISSVTFARSVIGQVASSFNFNNFDFKWKRTL